MALKHLVVVCSQCLLAFPCHSHTHSVNKNKEKVVRLAVCVVGRISVLGPFFLAYYCGIGWESGMGLRSGSMLWRLGITEVLCLKASTSRVFGCSILVLLSRVYDESVYFVEVLVED